MLSGMPRPQPAPAYPYDVPNRVPDVRKAKAILGFEATTPLDAMLDEVIAWVRGEMEADVLTSEMRAWRSGAPLRG